MPLTSAKRWFSSSANPIFIRPLNWPAGCPGRGTCMVETAKGQRVLVMNAMGRVMIEPMLDDPFPAVGRELDQCQLGRDCDAILIDFHAEASSEKMAMGHYVDGRASLLVGTHTHTPTADHQILAGGTGYLTDAGMCGDYNSVIGMDKAEPLNRFLRKLPVEKFKPAEGAATVCGVAVETDDRTGLATQISPIRLGRQTVAGRGAVLVESRTSMTIIPPRRQKNSSDLSPSHA